MKNTIYALGFFDGVHLGHQALLKSCYNLSRSHGCSTGVVTFASHPDTLVRGNTPHLINSPRDREWLLREKYHVEILVTLPFDEAMRSMPWEQFLDMLRRHYDAAGFVCGEDFRFGDTGRFFCAAVCRAALKPMGKDAAAIVAVEVEIGVAGHIQHGIGIGQGIVGIEQAVLLCQAAGDGHLQVAGVAFLPVGGKEGEAHGIRKDFAAPHPEGEALEASVDLVLLHVLGQGVGLLPYLQQSVGDGAGEAAYGGTEIF